MPAPGGLLKPCYVFAPRLLARRIGIAVLRKAPKLAVVRLPWGSKLEVNANETIGREIFRQNIFDIAVSEVAWRLLRPGDVAVDVGANIGYMTCLFARRVGASGRVEAFEPHPRLFVRLRSNVALNRTGVETVGLHEVALGSRPGIARLVEPSIFGVNEGTASVIADVDTNSGVTSARTFEVKMRRLDSILGKSTIGLLKLDVEGFEGEVLAGAEQLLSKQNIRHIVYEAHDCAQSPLHARLKSYGYTVFGIGHSLFGPKLTPGTAAPAIDRSWESPSYLASLDPNGVTALLREAGWQILRRARPLFSNSLA